MHSRVTAEWAPSSRFSVGRRPLPCPRCRRLKRPTCASLSMPAKTNPPAPENRAGCAARRQRSVCGHRHRHRRRRRQQVASRAAACDASPAQHQHAVSFVRVSRRPKAGCAASSACAWSGQLPPQRVDRRWIYAAPGEAKKSMSSQRGLGHRSSAAFSPTYTPAVAGARRCSRLARPGAAARCARPR